MVALLPRAAVDIEGPAGVVPFIQDLTASLKAAGIECEVPPIVYEQVGWCFVWCGCVCRGCALSSAGKGEL